ncbi:hypothetical protein BpHYR1_039250 [Brachionus plicatilis]|uniref:Uncharacterized protein n=1 Tax=Brachionus plicatilis TaxID=10195 RepID=A0A3M7QTX2_BRAPC|nr:hypothetical protein BpHYR1_039250 [Brachionus plicatilis]
MPTNGTQREESNDILIPSNEVKKSRINLTYFHYSIQHMFKILGYAFGTDTIKKVIKKIR